MSDPAPPVDDRYPADVVGGAQLQPAETPTTVRVQAGQPLRTSGPFASMKEVFGGYYLLEVDDLDAAGAGGAGSGSAGSGGVAGRCG